MIVSLAQASASCSSSYHAEAYLPTDLDVATLEDLLENNKQPLHLFLPLNTKRSLFATLQQAYKIHELDWWDSRRMDVDGIGSIKVTCTPAQHFSGRGLFDRNASLWASWAIEGLHRDTGESRMKVNERFELFPRTSERLNCCSQCYFGGDTGYCAVEDDKSHDLDESRPYCPAFKEIGDRFNGFDVSGRVWCRVRTARIVRNLASKN